MTMRFTLLFSLALAGSAWATDIETKDWGVTWKRQPCMTNVVGSLETPGSDSDNDWKLKAESFYAFLDGFDTRKRASSCTNIVRKRVGPGIQDYVDDYGTNALRQVTNTTFRLAFYDSFERRLEQLRYLNPNYSTSPNIDAINGYWGSTMVDVLELTKPAPNAFGWTEDVVPKFYNGQESGWFTTFYGLIQTGVFKPRFGRPVPSDYWFKGLAYDLIMSCTFGEPDILTFANADLRATPYTFEIVMTNVYDEVYASNIVQRSRRAIRQQLAGGDQVLALFDKTVRFDDPVTMITNRIDTYYKIKAESDATYSTSVELVKTNNTWIARPLNGSCAVSNLQITNIVDVTNNEQWAIAPYVQVSKPTYAAGASLTIQTYGGSAGIDGSTEAMRSRFNEFFERAGVSEGVLHVMFLALRYEFYGTGVYFACYPLDTESGMLIEENLAYEEPEPGTYTAKGKASFKASYSTHEGVEIERPATSIHKNWPAERTYLAPNGISTTFLSSFASTEETSGGGYGVIAFTDSEGDETEQWVQRIGYGYQCEIYSMNDPSQYYQRILYELNDILSIMQEDLDYMDPFTWTGFDGTDFARIMGDFNGWELVTMEDVWFGTPGGNSEVEGYVRKNADGTFDFAVGNTNAFSHTLSVLSSGFTLNPTNTLNFVDDYGYRGTPYVFSSKIRSVSEAMWDFPQVKRVKEDP